MNDWPEILSFGAGVNSTALAILAVNDGWRGEIVFADTGCEWPETYCFLQYFGQEWLKPRGVQVIQLRGLPWQTKSHGLSLVEYCEQAHVIPMAAVRWCTAEWKTEPLRRYAGERSQMIGIAADEAHRTKGRIAPLVDLGIDRKECTRIITNAGLPIPQKSGCWICPFQRPWQWRLLWERHPDLFARAEALEKNVRRRKDGYTATFDISGQVTLEKRRIAWENQLPLPEWDMDALREYQPCVCGL